MGTKWTLRNHFLFEEGAVQSSIYLHMVFGMHAHLPQPEAIIWVVGRWSTVLQLLPGCTYSSLKEPLVNMYLAFVNPATQLLHFSIGEMPLRLNQLITLLQVKSNYLSKVWISTE